MKKDLSIIILAAGKGSRMKSQLPKVLHKISGKEMLYYSINEARKLSDDIHIVLYHQANLVKSEMEKYFNDVSFTLQDHENYPGTGGAVMGLDLKYNKTLVLNGDMPLIQAEELQQLLLEDDETSIVMSVLKLDNAFGYGRVIIKDNIVEKIVEHKDCNKEELNINIANGGVYCFNTNFLQTNILKLSNNNSQKEYYITDLIEIAIKNNNIVKPIIVNQENFKGVNSKMDLADAEIIHQNRIKNDFMENGVVMRLPNTIYIEKDVIIKGESVLENGVTLLGSTEIINSHIKTNSIIENSVIINSDIGPMARVRPFSNIQDTHIGNFVEVKKSKLNGVKAGHLSYLGDSDIDIGTNIGAGTITCNYDGKNKFKTKIGKNVFVGSNTQLIAPIVLENNCIIGAGSTITKDVKSGELALTRAKTRIIKNYKGIK